MLGAGSLVIARTSTFTPSSAINVTMVTLEDIYQKIQDFEGYTDSPSHNLTTSDTPSGTMYTLQDIWDELSVLNVGGGLEWSVNQIPTYWDSAKRICEGEELNSSGDYFSGWRMATLGELAKAMGEKIVLYSEPDLEYQDSKMVPGTYWAGEYNDPDNAHTVNLNGDYSSIYYTEIAKNYFQTFKCVREI
jgi:hypothetical protein